VLNIFNDNDSSLPLIVCAYIYHFSQEDSFLKECVKGNSPGVGGSWIGFEQGMAGSHLNCSTYRKCYFTIYRMYVWFI